MWTPDNGMAVPDDNDASPATGITKVDPYSKKGSKYVFMEDLNQFYGSDKSLVIYQHLTRQDKAPQQINGLARRLQQCLNLPRLPWSLWYHRGNCAGLLHCCSRTARADHRWTGYKSLKGSRAGSSGKLVSNIRTSSW